MGVRLAPGEFCSLVNKENQKSVESVYNAQKLHLELISRISLCTASGRV